MLFFPLPYSSKLGSALDYIRDESIIYNDDGSITYEIDVPGCKAEDIDITSSGRTITVKAQRKGRTIEQFFTIGNGYDTENIDAVLSNGLLTINVRKIEKKKNQIQIREI